MTGVQLRRRDVGLTDPQFGALNAICALDHPNRAGVVTDPSLSQPVISHVIDQLAARAPATRANATSGASR